MLMPSAASSSNIVLRDAGVRAHADADDRDLADLVVVADALAVLADELGHLLLEQLDRALAIDLAAP